MFGLFKKQQPVCPVTEEERIWIEDCLIWLMREFGEEKLITTEMLLPVAEHFPIKFDGTEKMAADCLKIVAARMDVDPDSIKLRFYTQHLQEILPTGGQIPFGLPDEKEKFTAGLYEGKNTTDKFSIALEYAILKDAEVLVATIAHEIAHIKLMGEGRMKENYEEVTDLLTVFFGLGIFNANSAVKFYTVQGQWGHSQLGYLTQQQWGYALAVYAYMRGEKSPDWVKYLGTNVRGDFKRSEEYIYKNTDKVLV